MNRIDCFQEKAEFVSRRRTLTLGQKRFRLAPRALNENQQSLDTQALWQGSSFFDDREAAARMAGGFRKIPLQVA